MYKETSINTTYLKSGECILNLLIVTTEFLFYFNARSISDTDT